MRLIYIDSDKSYLNQFRCVVSQMGEKPVEVITCFSVHEYADLPDSMKTNAFVAVNESLIFDLLEDTNSSLIGNIAIVTEGIVEEEWLLKLRNHKWFSKMPIHRIIKKYQKMQDFMNELQSLYLDTTGKTLAVSNSKSRLTTIFTPYGNSKSSHRLEMQIQDCQKFQNCLLIHYDPFFRSKEKDKFNLSYLVGMIKKGKKNIGLIVNELVICGQGNTDILYGPGNMQDIDCLTANEMESFIHELRSRLDYGHIVINMCGVHLTKNLMMFLESADTCLLICANEDIQFGVLQQTAVKWHFGNEDGKWTREVFRNRDN